MLGNYFGLGRFGKSSFGRTNNVTSTNNGTQCENPKRLRPKRTHNYSFHKEDNALINYGVAHKHETVLAIYTGESSKSRRVIWIL
jgi:hypothetical protein